MKLRVTVVLLLSGAVAASATGCGEMEGEEIEIETKQDNLYVLTSTLWPTTSQWGYPTASVCWEQATGFDNEKNWVRDSIQETWQLESQFRFLGWGNCGASTGGIRVQFIDGTGNSLTGTQLDGVANGMQLNTWASGNGNCVAGWSRERCVRSTAVHEFGHGLGYKHEHKRPDKPASCTQTTGASGDLAIGPWDGDSVMNYCNPIRNGDARLSGTDVHGQIEMYGHPTPVVASTWGGTTMAAFIRGPGNALYEAFSNDGVSWTNFFSQGGSLTSAPTVASWGSDRLDVFARGTDGAVWQKYWTFAGGWSGWGSLGGFIKGKPKVIARASNRLDVFARGSSDALFHRGWNGSSWSAWTSLGDDIVGEPAISSWGSNRLDVLVRSRDNNLRHRSWNGTSWSSWTNLGGGDLVSSPSAASWGTNRVDVVAVRGDLALWHRAWNGTSWSGWSSLGGTILGNPRITARTANILDIFVRASDNAIWQRSWTGSAWTGWSSHGGVLKGSPEVQTPNANKVEITAQGSDDMIYRKTWTGSWTGWIQIGGATVE